MTAAALPEFEDLDAFRTHYNKHPATLIAAVVYDETDNPLEFTIAYNESLKKGSLFPLETGGHLEYVPSPLERMSFYDNTLLDLQSRTTLAIGGVGSGRGNDQDVPSSLSGVTSLVTSLLPTFKGNSKVKLRTYWNEQEGVGLSIDEWGVST